MHSRTDERQPMHRLRNGPNGRPMPRQLTRRRERRAQRRQRRQQRNSRRPRRLQPSELRIRQLRRRRAQQPGPTAKQRART